MIMAPDCNILVANIIPPNFYRYFHYCYQALRGFSQLLGYF